MGHVTYSVRVETVQVFDSGAERVIKSYEGGDYECLSDSDELFDGLVELIQVSEEETD